MTPDLQPDVPLLEVLGYGVLNPATIAVAFLMGQKADEKSKIMIAGFAGAIAGVAVLYIATFLRLWDAPTLGRAIAGVFITSLVAGSVYGGIGYMTTHRLGDGK